MGTLIVVVIIAVVAVVVVAVVVFISIIIIIYYQPQQTPFAIMLLSGTPLHFHSAQMLSFLFISFTIKNSTPDYFIKGVRHC